MIICILCWSNIGNIIYTKVWSLECWKHLEAWMFRSQLNTLFQCYLGNRLNVSVKIQKINQERRLFHQIPTEYLKDINSFEWMQYVSFIRHVFMNFLICLHWNLSVEVPEILRTWQFSNQSNLFEWLHPE